MAEVARAVDTDPQDSTAGPDPEPGTGQVDPVADRAGEPVTPIGPPEPVDLELHPRATMVGVVALVALFLFASFAIGRAFSDGERRADVPRVPVPKLEGRTLEEAQRALGPLQLLVTVEYQPNEVIPSGVVFDQRPVAGAKLEIGTEVTLVVSDGPAGLTVPDVRGFQGGEATSLLQALGFSPSAQQVFDEAVRPGEVVATTPAAGNRAVPGAPVAVLVSNGPAPRTVPAVVDQTEADGLAALGRSGVGLGTVTTTFVQGKDPGIVLSTDPAPGSAIPRGYPVNVSVSGPPATLTVPQVSGLLQSSASTIVGSTTLSLSIRNQTVPAGDPRVGRVISQSIPGGSAVEAGTPLQLVVGVEAPPPTTTTPPVATTPTTTPTTTPATTTTTRR